LSWCDWLLHLVPQALISAALMSRMIYVLATAKPWAAIPCALLAPISLAEDAARMLDSSRRKGIVCEHLAISDFSGKTCIPRSGSCKHLFLSQISIVISRRFTLLD